MLIKKGSYVRVRQHVLLPEDRLSYLPTSTSNVHLKSWTKGELLDEAELYEEAKIKTATNRIVSGEVKELEPKYKHDFGDYVEELHSIRSTILKEMWGDEDA